MRRQRGFSLIELLITVAIILVITAIAVPNLLRSRMATNEAATVATFRSINTAQGMYQSVYPQNGFAASLAVLGPPPSGSSADPSNAGLLDNFIGCTSPTCVKNGYEYQLTGDPSVGITVPGYTLSAIPLRPSTSGVRGFCSSEDSMIHVEQVAASSAYIDKTACRALTPLR